MVSKWETNASYPEPEKLVAIAAFYHVSVDFLLRGEDAEPDREPRHGYPFFRRFHYEYKSKRTFLGLPLVHVNVGPGLCRAKGVIAVGNVATGLICKSHPGFTERTGSGSRRIWCENLS